MDFKNEQKLRQKKRKFEKSKEDDGDRSNQAQKQELKFCYWLKKNWVHSSFGISIPESFLLSHYVRYLLLGSATKFCNI